jgi:hypothetical protein
MGGRRVRVRGEYRFEFARGGEGVGKGGVWVSLSYEAKNKRQKLRCLLLRRKKSFFLYIYEVITYGKKEKKALLFSSCV